MMRLEASECSASVDFNQKLNIKNLKLLNNNPNAARGLFGAPDHSHSYPVTVREKSGQLLTS